MSTSYKSDSFLQYISMAIFAVTRQSTAVSKYTAVASTCQVNHGVIKLVFMTSVSAYSDEIDRTKNTTLTSPNTPNNIFLILFPCKEITQPYKLLTSVITALYQIFSSCH